MLPLVILMKACGRAVIYSITAPLWPSPYYTAVYRSFYLSQASSGVRYELGRDGHCGSRYAIDDSRERLLNNFMALSKYWPRIVAAWSAAEAGLRDARSAYLDCWQNVARSVSCSERTAHRSAASVMDDGRQGTDERAKALRYSAPWTWLAEASRPYDVVRLSIMLDLFSLGCARDPAR